MRYISIYESLDLLALEGNIKYQFKNGVLQVGTPTSTAAGNIIDPAQASSDPKVKMQILYPAGADDDAKVGMGSIYFQSPPIIAAGTLASGSYYELTAGTADLTNAAYVGKYTLVLPSALPSSMLATAPVGIIIKATATITVPAGTETWNLALSPRYMTEKEYNTRVESFRINELSGFGDESYWNEATYQGAIKDHKYVR